MASFLNVSCLSFKFWEPPRNLLDVHLALFFGLLAHVSSGSGLVWTDVWSHLPCLRVTATAASSPEIPLLAHGVGLVNHGNPLCSASYKLPGFCAIETWHSPNLRQQRPLCSFPFPKHGRCPHLALAAFRTCHLSPNQRPRPSNLVGWINITYWSAQCHWCVSAGALFSL